MSPADGRQVHEQMPEGPEGEEAFEPGAMPFDEALHNLCQAHGIAAVYVFGPPAGGHATESGDPDVGVIFFGSPADRGGGSEVQPDLLREFRVVFGAEALAVGDLHRTGPAQQYRAIKGRVLYAAAENRRAQFEEQVVRDYQDFAFEMRLFDEERAEEIAREGGGG